ncbi:uncharacterized protein BO72DRAFT_284711 [Aspergillus fijiensis CBS 313.89]|uniref:Uncharacterized protein n=1 Tax=Aspergillus fijiensis CBS 313.89 TaxID=1448319 RepID=A0A8G1RW40_9EURO|nr:uncharacterized protein BO72DRAFT_284711 [Aspergillus fijiensis CBS 313.89]RAK80615.1 hypothetical protein BO72DRAFT_284711 [Aspergillus fijiensis CBS 313.89]
MLSVLRSLTIPGGRSASRTEHFLGSDTAAVEKIHGQLHLWYEGLNRNQKWRDSRFVVGHRASGVLLILARTVCIFIMGYDQLVGLGALFSLHLFVCTLIGIIHFISSFVQAELVGACG